MTRFEKKISGKLGDFWKNDAEKEVRKAVEKATNDAVVESDGAIKWKQSGNYLMDDFCEKLEYANFNFNRNKTAEKRNAQITDVIMNLRNQRVDFSAEEKMELDANNKPGTVIVNVITGNKYVTK